MKLHFKEEAFQIQAVKVITRIFLPAHNSLSIGVSIGANTFTFNSLEEVIAFSNGASNEAGKRILNLINLQ